MALRWWRKEPKPEPRAEEKPAAAPPAAAALLQHVEPLLPPPPPPEERAGWLAKLTGGLRKTRGSFTDQVRSLFGEADRVDESVIDDLEAILIQADCGPAATAQLVETLRTRVRDGDRLTGESAMSALKAAIAERLSRSAAPLKLAAKPSVVLVVGVNGVGKTTTIAKVARIFQAYGKKIMLVAGDTFRAGAIEQLQIWSQRLGCEFMHGAAGGDPSAVVFDGVSAARARGLDMVIIDTAGRLHTQTNLMEELGKVQRVIKKVIPDAPHETLLVLDATTGQNALNQAKLFDQVVPITGLVLTKLDGTAKGGVVVALADQLEVPIRFVGVGEGIDDLANFRAEEFVAALFR